MSLLLWGGCMGNDSILPECGGLADYSDTKERKEMTQGADGFFLSPVPVRAFLCAGQFLFVGDLFFSAVPAG